MPKFRYFPICFARRTSDWVKEFGSQGTMLSSTLTDKPCSINSSWCGRGVLCAWDSFFCTLLLTMTKMPAYWKSGHVEYFHGFTVLPLQQQKCNILDNAAFWIDFHRSTMHLKLHGSYLNVASMHELQFFIFFWVNHWASMHFLKSSFNQKRKRKKEKRKLPQLQFAKNSQL